MDSLRKLVEYLSLEYVELSQHVSLEVVGIERHQIIDIIVRQVFVL